MTEQFSVAFAMRTHVHSIAFIDELMCARELTQIIIIIYHFVNLKKKNYGNFKSFIHVLHHSPYRQIITNDYFYLLLLLQSSLNLLWLNWSHVCLLIIFNAFIYISLSDTNKKRPKTDKSERIMNNIS